MNILRRGFTLIELLIVIIMVAILAAVGTSMMQGAIDKADGDRAISNLRICAAAARVYFNNTGDTTALNPGTIGAINTTYSLQLQDANFLYNGNQTGTAYSFTATKNVGRYLNSTITITWDAVNGKDAWDGNWPWIPTE